MKCPKCGYLGFERVDRCRNCGYDFSLTSPTAVPDITLRRDTQTINPLDDLSLTDDAAAPDAATAGMGVDLDRVFGAPDTPDVRRAGLSGELPLFGQSMSDGEALITRASPPRSPLSVRRATPEVARVRAEQPRAQSLDLALELDGPESMAAPMLKGSRADLEQPGPHNAGIGARFVAVVIDLLILAVTDAAVIYFTMQILDLTVADLGILPKGPLIAFLLVQNGGYLVAFTAGGQTLGKMVAGIRVVPTDSEDSLDLGRAFLRTLMWLMLAVPVGLGFLTALFSRDHRGLHDRFAGTRVVR